MQSVKGVAGPVTYSESVEASQLLNAETSQVERPVHHLEESPEESSDESSEDYDLYLIMSSSKPKLY